MKRILILLLLGVTVSSNVLAQGPPLPPPPPNMAIPFDTVVGLLLLLSVVLGVWKLNRKGQPV